MTEQTDSKELHFRVDGQPVVAKAGQSVMQACDEAGIYIPRLCDSEGLVPQGSCRVCSIKVNGKVVAACTQPASEGAEIEHETGELNGYRKDLVQMLFHEGNHLCPICEASGHCELQGMAYRFGLAQASNYPYLQPVRPVDASHPDVALDTNRCILCGRCIRASKDVDGKHVFGYVGRGIHKRVAVNGRNLADTDTCIDDYAVSNEVCPVGCILRKGEGFYAPVGERHFDHEKIGSDVEQHHIHHKHAQQIKLKNLSENHNDSEAEQ